MVYTTYTFFAFTNLGMDQNPGTMMYNVSPKNRHIRIETHLTIDIIAMNHSKFASLYFLTVTFPFYSYRMERYAIWDNVPNPKHPFQ